MNVIGHIKVDRFGASTSMVSCEFHNACIRIATTNIVIERRRIQWNSKKDDCFWHFNWAKLRADFDLTDPIHSYSST